jgi:hypothetical protein
MIQGRDLHLPDIMETAIPAGLSLLLLNGGNPLDELLLIGGAILVAWLIIRLTRSDKPEKEEEGGAESDNHAEPRD